MRGVYLVRTLCRLQYLPYIANRTITCLKVPKVGIVRRSLGRGASHRDAVVVWSGYGSS
jgi:hypothetical protein